MIILKCKRIIANLNTIFKMCDNRIIFTEVKVYKIKTRKDKNKKRQTKKERKKTYKQIYHFEIQMKLKHNPQQNKTFPTTTKLKLEHLLKSYA